MNASIALEKSTRCVTNVRFLPASKSISNRALLLNALAGGGATLHHLSEANDTRLMEKLLASQAATLDAHDAGTTFRFLTAYLALREGTTTLTGTERMQQRPIGILAGALTTLGAGIRYLGKEGYPPLEITGLRRQNTRTLSIRGDVSSQYISALMMIGPLLPDGLELKFTGTVGSLPYLEMTATLMKTFGVACALTSEGVTIPTGKYHPAELDVEPDWSAVGYWYAFAALAGESDVFLPRVQRHSIQGDRVADEIMARLGVSSKETGEGLRLTKGPTEQEVTWDFTHCPDLAQTVAVVCASKGVKGTFTGLQSLRIKETDRIAALQTELGKLGARLEEGDGRWTLHPSERLPSTATIATYKDHRMAMAFAPLMMKMDVTIEDPGVVAKSYPRFWEDVGGIGK